MAQENESEGQPVEIPQDYESFLRLQETAIQTAEKQRALRIKGMVGDSPGPEELAEAETLAEEEIINSIREKRKLDSLPDGLIGIIPPEPENGKGMMVSLYSEDPVTLSVFNLAASEVTEKHGGFNQVGARNKTGLSSWELRTPKNARSLDVIRETFETMKKMNPGKGR